MKKGTKTLYFTHLFRSQWTGCIKGVLCQQSAIGSAVPILYWVKIRHLPLTWPVAVNTVLALPRSL